MHKEDQQQFEYDLSWLEGQAQECPEAYTLESFCSLFKVNKSDVQQAYYSGDELFFEKLQQKWEGDPK